MTERFDAEERAFRDSLRRAAEAESFQPIDAADLPKAAPGRGWPTAVAAAVVLGLVGLLGFTVLPYLQQAGTATMGAAPAEAPPDAGGGVEAQSAPEMAPAPARDGEPGDPQPGFRWESYRDVVVQVPEDWGYGQAPTSAWCISEEWPQAPYVDLAHNLGAVPAIFCEGVIPADKLVPYLAMAPEPVATVESLPDGWTAHRLTVGNVVVTVVIDDAGAALAEQILATAKQVPVDHNGCPTAAPPQASETDLAGLAGLPIVLCAYDTNPDAWPGLRSSTRLDGEAAAAAWDAILAAPGGGGPDGSEAECGTLPAESEAFLLIKGTAVGFRFGGCTGNGLADAGAEDGLREVTEDLCRTLLVPPFWMNAASGPAANRCLGVLWER